MRQFPITVGWLVAILTVVPAWGQTPPGSQQGGTYNAPAGTGASTPFNPSGSRSSPVLQSEFVVPPHCPFERSEPRHSESEHPNPTAATSYAKPIPGFPNPAPPADRDSQGVHQGEDPHSRRPASGERPHHETNRAKSGICDACPGTGNLPLPIPSLVDGGWHSCSQNADRSSFNRVTIWSSISPKCPNRSPPKRPNRSLERIGSQLSKALFGILRKFHKPCWFIRSFGTICHGSYLIVRIIVALHNNLTSNINPNSPSNGGRTAI